MSKKVLQKIHQMSIQEVQRFLPSLENGTIESLYWDAVDYKKVFPLAYERLLNELNRRKTQQIEEAI